MKKRTKIQPREKLATIGIKSLSRVELLALVLGSGTKTQRVTTLAHNVLKKYPFSPTQSPSLSQLMKLKGIGQAKACQILATLELGKRIMNQPPHLFINSAQDILEHVSYIKNETREHLIALYLDSQANLIKKQVISIGNFNQNFVEARDVYQEAVKLPCAGVVIAHNHPSDDPTPSDHDIIFTKTLVEAGELLGITLADHVIVCKNRFFSMRENGVI